MMKIPVTPPGGQKGSNLGVLSPEWLFLVFVLKILNDCSLDFSEILHEVTTTQRRKNNIPEFSIKILVASPGGQKWSKMAILTLFGVRSQNSQRQLIRFC